MKNREWDYPQWTNTTSVSVDRVTLRTAERQIASCEACTPELADIPFDYILDCLTGCDPQVTDYVLAAPARCPRCAATLQTGYWRWQTSEPEGHKVFILPGTLVTLKDE